MVDKFNATPWDYAKNRQLHYCQLIIMSHQRQRLVSNPNSPLPNGLGLMMNGGMNGYFSRGDFESTDFDYAVSGILSNSFFEIRLYGFYKCKIFGMVKTFLCGAFHFH